MKTCQFCSQEIESTAIVCHYCTRSQLNETQRKKYVDFIVEQKMSGGTSIKGNLIWAGIMLAGFYIVVDNFQKGTVSGIITLVIALVIWGSINTFFERQAKKLNLVDLKTEYDDYRDRATTLKSIKDRIFWGIIVALLVTAIFSNPSTQEFREYYLYHNPDSEIFAIYKENYIIYSEFKIKLRTGEEETYTGGLGSLGGFQRKATE